MCKGLRIDFVAPPFAGHLFPCLQLATGLTERGLRDIRVLTTAGGINSARTCNLKTLELLPGKDDCVQAIANTKQRVGSNPLAMWRQCRDNLALMSELCDQLRGIWSEQRPDLVIADFAVPVAGLTAKQQGIAWWTGMPTPCALETQTGTPSYLGGWRPRHDRFGRFRDWCGRRLVRTFKTTMAAVFSRQLRELSITRLYRADGTEVIYSDERILAYGMAEFEFSRDWPPWLEFIGPLIGSPPVVHSSPKFVPGRKTVLVSMGTHLPWVREKVANLFAEVASLLPDWEFHISSGRPGHDGATIRDNLHCYDYVPYDRFLDRYDLAVIHGGTGITYACIQAGQPMLVWPQDYDQFDHAARIVEHGLGKRMTPRASAIAASLQEMVGNRVLRERLHEFQDKCRSYDARRWLSDAIREFSRSHRSSRGT